MKRAIGAALALLGPGAALGAEELQAFARERLAVYKVPSRVVFRAVGLPRNATNKVLKRELRASLFGA